MNKQRPTGFVVLDRKGEYIKDTIDQRGNSVFGLQNHPKALEKMVVVSKRNEFAEMKRQGMIYDHLPPTFSIRDIDPIDLADFLPGFTPQQADLVKGYAHVSGFYDKLLAETTFGAVDKSTWYTDFPGLYELNEAGKRVLKEIERDAVKEGRNEMTPDEIDKLMEKSGPGGTKPVVLERAAMFIKRFCQNPFFGEKSRGRDILAVSSSLPQIMAHLATGRFVFLDMLGQADEYYTMVAALIARRLLSENKRQEDEDHIRACIVMEEAHNILSEAEVAKGEGRGSVFIELAREGRSFKIGFVLVTQQPDARSIALQVVKTIDTVVAFNMPPDDANHLQRLKPAFSGLELQISNAREFSGVAVKDAGPVFFRSEPITKQYMMSCANGTLVQDIQQQGEPEPNVSPALDSEQPVVTMEDRLTTLMKQRRERIQPVALETMRIWQGEDTGPKSS